MFSFQNLSGGEAEPAEAAPVGVPEAGPVVGHVPSKFDLTLAITEGSETLSGVFEYATDLFDEATISRTATHFRNVLETVLEDPDRKIGDFCFLSAEEQHLILNQWNDTSREWSEVLALPERFTRWAEKTPDATAVILGDQAVTYQDLDRRSDRVAGALQARGVGRGDVVGICIPRSVELVAGLLGILKAGAAYLPLDVDLPGERTAFMLRDAGVNQVVTTTGSSRTEFRPPVETVLVDEPSPAAGAAPVVVDALCRPPTEWAPSDPAYVIYTSGSTGVPKGVVVSHGAIDNRLQWMQARYLLGRDDRVLQKTPYTFDVSVWEIFWPLSEGACLVLAEPERHKESRYLVETIERYGVTCVHFVPSMLQAFLCEDLSRCSSLKRIICSGEAMTVEQCRRLRALPGVSAHNLYGPTEAAVDVTHWDCAEWQDHYRSVPIGRPIANTSIYILNQKLQPVPVGVSGELHIGGANLAEGYLHQKELTQKRFISSPFAAPGLLGGGRLYKTGDLARFLPDGNIEYLGRLDRQVKLRGARIEPEEIETVLRRHPAIADAVVTIHSFGADDERLVAYVVPLGQADFPDAAAIRAFAGRTLPSHMVPTVIVPINELPVTSNGKLDRARLPAPATAPGPAGAEGVGDLEQLLLEIWSKYLQVGSLKVTDDFFASGGHSILAFRVMNSISKRFQIDLPVRLLFQYPTIESLAAAIRQIDDDTWLASARATAEMFAQSPRHLLGRLDELSEEELDEVL
ncbi:MAG TPA: amino acid adenylation domain-containing protein, partial [Acidimicrobiales bacterium]|nr:amino acid adenylation domain-containing protein [Acidimicrobiales bacterium]